MYYNKDLNVFREGGSHAVNPIGGIPQGMGANGKPNLVEEGETAFDLKNGKYIFSDRLNLSKDMKNSLITEFNLPNYVKGKTFAEASKLIEKKFKDRNDNASTKTKEALMERLQEAQEYIKMQDSMKINAQEVPAMSNDIPPGMNEFSGGGFTNFLKTNGAGIAGAAAGIGGIVNDIQGNTSMNKGEAGLGGAAKGALAGLALGPIGAAVGGVLGGIGGLIGAGKRRRNFLKEQKNDTLSTNSEANNIYSEGGMIDPDYPVNPNDLISSFKTNKDALNYSNPYPERSNRWNIFDTYQRKLKSSAFGQADTSPLATRTYKDINGFKGEPLKDEVNYINELKKRDIPPVSNKEYLKNIGNAITNKFSKGGNLYEDGGFTDSLNQLNKFKTEPLKSFSIDEALAVKKPSLADSIFGEVNPQEKQVNDIGSKLMPKFDFTPKIGASTSKNNNDKKGLDLAKALQFAPAIGSLFNRANLEKAPRESRAKIGTKFQKELMDEMRLQNIAANQFNNTSEAIANASGGSKAATRAGILGAGLNRNKALSASYGQADDVNRAQSNMAQQFNFGTDRVNLYQDNLEKEVNARNEAAYETEKSRMNDAIYNSIGNIGKEIIDKRSVAKMFGYTWDGKYIKDSKGNIVSDDKLKKQIEQLKKG